MMNRVLRSVWLTLLLLLLAVAPSLAQEPDITDLQQWLDAEPGVPVSCPLIIWIAQTHDHVPSQAIVNLHSMGREACEASVAGLTRREIWETFRDGELYDGPPMPTVQVISDPGGSTGDEPEPKPFHTHNCAGCEQSDHSHGSGTGGTLHHNVPHSE